MYEAAHDWQPRFIRPGVSGLRYFSPTEVARLMHFPGDFAFPPGTRFWVLGGVVDAQACKLAGNPLYKPSPPPPESTTSHGQKGQVRRRAGALRDAGAGRAHQAVAPHGDQGEAALGHQRHGAVRAYVVYASCAVDYFLLRCVRV